MLLGGSGGGLFTVSWIPADGVVALRPPGVLNSSGVLYQPYSCCCILCCTHSLIQVLYVSCSSSVPEVSESHLKFVCVCLPSQHLPLASKMCVIKQSVCLLHIGQVFCGLFLRRFHQSLTLALLIQSFDLYVPRNILSGISLGLRCFWQHLASWGAVISSSGLLGSVLSTVCALRFCVVCG